MSTPFDTYTIEHAGRNFVASLFNDSDSRAAPWEEYDGHGIIRQTYSPYSRPDKKPGETIMHHTRGEVWLYDVQATTAKAKKEGWELCDAQLAKLAAQLGRAPTPGEVTAAAVQFDLEYCSGFLRGDWSYIGVGVQLVGPDGEPQDSSYTHAVWGIESTGDYWREVAAELAGEIMHSRASAWRAALKEARARKYWASRDVVTV